MADQFPDSVIERVWTRAAGKCECMDLASCRHQVVPHARKLEWDDRGNDDSIHGWEAHHIDPNGELTASNCRILCIECHKNTPSYGRPTAKSG